MRSLLVLLAFLGGLAQAATDRDRWTMIEAVKRGDAPTVEAMLARGVAPGTEGEVLYMPRKVLSIAAEAGHDAVVELLLRHGADPESANDFPSRFAIHGSSPSRSADNRKTALMYAAQAGHVAVVRRLIAARARLDATTIYGETALMLAAGAGRADTVGALLEAGADLRPAATEKNNLAVQYRDYGGTALSYGLRYAITARLRAKEQDCKGHLATAEALVTAHEARKQRIGKAGQEMVWALNCGDAPLVSRLVALGAVEKGSDILLYVNQAQDRSEVVEMLLRAGADVNARAPFKDTPLMRAASSGALRNMTVLLDRGAAINAVTAQGESALFHAARGGHAAAVALLLARGADPNLVAAPSPKWFSNGGTALAAAVEKNCLECARELLARGADPKLADASGNTPVETLRRAGLLK